MPNPCAFVDTTARATRTGEVPDADWDTGVNYGSCNPGVGIATQTTNMTENPGKWTLLDQNGAARTPQDGQSIGGVGLNGGVTTASNQPFKIIINGTTGDGSITGSGNATLATLSAGWTSV